jgi:hypothetical protein
MKGIAERFPPLKSRVPNWSADQLLVASRSRTTVSDSARGRILLQEIIARQNLSRADFRDLVDRRVGWAQGDSLPPVILESVSSPSGLRFLADIQEYFQYLSDPLKEGPEDSLLRTLNRLAQPGTALLLSSFCSTATRSVRA